MATMITIRSEEAAAVVRQTLTDSHQRSRMLWASACWVITAVLMGFGTTYLVGGVRTVPVAGAYAFITEYLAPVGGMRFYGGLMVVIGLTFLDGLLIEPLHGRGLNDAVLHVALRFFVGAATGIIVMFGLSWALSGVQTWQAIIYWGSLGALALAAAKLAPDPAPPARAA